MISVADKVKILAVIAEILPEYSIQLDQIVDSKLSEFITDLTDRLGTKDPIEIRTKIEADTDLKDKIVKIIEDHMTVGDAAMCLPVYGTGSERTFYEIKHRSKMEILLLVVSTVLLIFLICIITFVNVSDKGAIEGALISVITTIATGFSIMVGAHYNREKSKKDDTQ